MLIIITGLPCTGKTSIGKRLSEKFSLPFIYKDAFKEIIFDNLEARDREWSLKVGQLAYRLMYYVLENFIACGKSVIIDSNFKPEYENVRFRSYREKYRTEMVQILCKAEGQALYERFKQRAKNGERHPGHVDDKNYDEFREMLLKGRIEKLEIEGECFEVDTTDFAKLDLAAVESYLAASGL